VDLTIAAVLNGLAERSYGPRVVAVKELTQLANRRRFHLEKAFFAAGISGIFVFAIISLRGGRGMNLNELSSFGRDTFLGICSFANGILAFAALGSSTGIIMSEIQGHRLDILRITPLSLSGVIVGKAFAIAGKSALVLTLLLPVMAATYLAGGVAPTDIAMGLVLTVNTVFLFTCMGLLASATATTAIERVIRPVVYMFVWSFCTSIILVPISAVPFLRRYLWLTAVSPWAVWHDLTNSQLSWEGVFANTVSAAVGAMIFLRAAGNALRRNIVARDEKPPERKLQTFVLTSPGLDKHRRRFARFSIRALDFVVKRAGGLVGGQILRTGMLAILAPLALIALMIVVLGCMEFLRPMSPSEFAGPLLLFAACLMALVAAVVGMQACGIIAREKAEHTAEILATTPAGGFGMIRWKGAAVFVTQAAAVIGCLLLVTSASLCAGAEAWAYAVWVGGFAATLALVFALGASLSLSVKTPAVAVGLSALTLFALTPIVTYAVIPVSLGPNGQRTGSTIVMLVSFFAVGGTLMVFRNLIPVVSAPALCASVSAVLGAGSCLCAWRGGMQLGCYVPAAPAVLPAQRPWGLQAAFIAIAVQLVAACLLVLGARINFDRVFLRGVRSKK
jgi:hypothetical protein